MSLLPVSRSYSVRRALLLGACVLAVSLLLGRMKVLDFTLDRAGAAARRLSGFLGGPAEATASAPEGSSSPETAGIAVLLSWLESGIEPPPQGGEEESPEEGEPDDSSVPHRARVNLGPEPPQSVRLTQEGVLRLAEAQTMPRGVSRSEAWGMPAGIEILDGGALGIGWHPGDRLTHVEGVPVFDRSLVIRKVLERRAEGAPVISGTLARRTSSGVKFWQIVVEQPYLGNSGSAVLESANPGHSQDGGPLLPDPGMPPRNVPGHDPPPKEPLKLEPLPSGPRSGP